MSAVPGMSNFMNGQGSGYDFGSSATAGGNDNFNISGPTFGAGSGGLAISTPVLLAGIAVIGLLLWGKK